MQTRGGLAAAAAFLERAVALTDDPARRAERALAAAQASLGAGTFEAAHALLAAAEAGPLDELERARAGLMQAELAFAQDRGGDAPVLLARAARKLESLDVRLSRDTYLEAWGAALFAGHLAGRRRWPARHLANGAARFGGSAAAPRPAARRSGSDLHRGTKRRDPGPASGGRGVRVR